MGTIKTLNMKQNATGAVVTNQLMSFYGETKPQISNIIYYNHKYILPMNVYKTLGLEREIQGETAQHFEAGWIHPNFHAAANATASGAGANLTFNVSTNDVNNNTVYARVTDTLLFKDGTAGSIITKTNLSPGVWQLVVSPYAPGYTLAVAAGDAIWIIGNTQAERTGNPAPRVTGKELLQYPLQIVKETWAASGSALTNEEWFDKDQFGNMRDVYTSGYLDAEFRFVEQLGNISTFGPVNSNPNNADVNMYSIDYVVDTQGNEVPYIGGNYGINEIKEHNRYANKKASGTKFLALIAPELNLSMTTGLSDVFSQNPNLFGTVGNSEMSSLFMAGYESAAEEKGVQIEFTKVRYGGYNYHLCPVHQWGTEVGGGANGFEQTGNGYFIPLTKSQDAEGTPRDRFCMTYKRKDRWNRSMQVWETGAQAATPTNDVDELNVNFLGHWGTEFFGAEHFQKAALAAA